jgi:hypothetical protein
MDKNSLSSFGWIIIAVIIVSLLIAFAPKYTSTVEDGYFSVAGNLLSQSGIKQYNLTISGNDKGKIEFKNKNITEQGTCSIVENEKISFTVTPNTGYKYVKTIITCNGNQYVLLASDPQSFTTTKGDVNIELFFEKI